MKLNNLESALKVENGLQLLNVKHCIGIVVFGVLCYVGFSDYRYLLYLPRAIGLNTFIYFIAIFMISAVIAYKAVIKNPVNNAAVYTQNEKNGYVYFMVRLLFLFAYEFYFRGVMFFMLIDLVGLLFGVLLTTVLYVTMHIFDAKEEIFGAIPFGILLCLMTFFTQSIWAAFLIHITLSGVYEVSIFKVSISKKATS